MKKRTKTLALLMAMVLAMGSMTACGSDSDSDKKDTDTKTESNSNEESGKTEDIKLTVWTPQEEKTDYSKIDSKYSDGLIQYMCNAFNDAHPEWNIEFEYKVCAESDAYKELSKDAAAGGDVFMFAGDQTVDLVQSGIASQLVVSDELKNDNPENAFDTVTIDDGIYGVPFTPNTWFMYYDKSKYSEEEVQSLDTMMAKDTGCEYNFSLDLDNGWYNAGFFYGAGCTLFKDDQGNDDESKCTFNDENGLAAAKVMLGLAKNKKFLCDDDSDAGLSQLKKGKLAAYCSGTWKAADVKAALGDNYAATVLPKININGEEVQMKSIGSYKYVGVNKNTKYPKAAQELALWLAGTECQNDRFVARGVTPTLKTLTDSAEVQADIASVALTAQTQYIAETPQSKKFSSNFWTSMEALGKGMLNGEINDKNLKKQLDLTVENLVTDIAK